MATALRELLVASKKKKADRMTVRIEFMVTEEWEATFRAAAKSWGMDLSTYIRTACEEKRRREKPPQMPAE